MRKFLALYFVAYAAAYPSIEFDYNVTPNLACGIMHSSFATAFIGIKSIGTTEVFVGQPLHRTNDTVSSCPPTYCNDVSAPLNSKSCMEYPFPGTIENNLANYACVNADELKLHNNMLADFYITKNITNGNMFKVKLLNMDLDTCTIPFTSVNTGKLENANSHYN
jgi:hypothetical protein